MSELELINLNRKDIDYIENIPLTYSELVEEGKNLINLSKLIKLKLAKLAIKACTIKHGGISNNYYTLKNFAEDVGVCNKQLSDWVLVYKRVVKPANMRVVEEKDWSIAKRVSDRIAKEEMIIRSKMGIRRSKFKPPELPKEVLKEMITEARKPNGDLAMTQRYLVSAVNSIKNIKVAKSCDVNILLDINEKCQIFIEIASGIQNKTIELVEGKHG